jgi:Tol biopolymer transport system component
VVGPAADSDLWIVDTATGALTRASFGLAPHRPVWTPDGRGVTVGAEGSGRWRLVTVPASGAGAPETLLESDHRVYPCAWAADGRALVFEERREGTDWDLRLLATTTSGKPAGAPRDLVATPFQERNAALSPDGRLLAFESNEVDGVNGVYVAPIAEPNAKVRATPTFANWPRWGKDGALYYWYPAQARPGDTPDAEGVYRIGLAALAAPAGRAAAVWPPGPALSQVTQRLVLGPASGFDVDAAGATPRFLFLETSAVRLDVPLSGPVLVLGWTGPEAGAGAR